MSQAKHILNVLEENGEGFLVAKRLDGRWSVEVAGGGEHVGESIADALGQATTVLALELNIDPEDPWLPADTFTVDEPVEFCPVVPFASDEYLSHVLGENAHRLRAVNE